MELFLLALIVGVFVGVLSGLLGIGGGTVMVPLFRLGFGMTAIQATATSLFTIIPTSVAGCINHIRNKTCIVPLGIAAGVGGAFTSMVGVWLANISPSWAIIIVAACVIAFSALTMLKKALNMKLKATRSDEPDSALGTTPESSAETEQSVVCLANGNAAAVIPPSSVDDRKTMTPRELGFGAGIGLIAGLASGYIGVGGGFLMVPLFVAVLNVPMKKASGTSLVAIIILCIPGAIEQLLLGNVQVMAGVAMAIGSIPGALVGANLVQHVPERALRLMFGALLLVVAVIMAVNELSPLFA